MESKKKAIEHEAHIGQAMPPGNWLVANELTAAPPMTAEASQQHINECARRHLELFGAQPEAPAPFFAAETKPTVLALLAGLIDDLVAWQHTRASEGRGHSTPWQNAQAHIRKAIECIERQAAADETSA